MNHSSSFLVISDDFIILLDQFKSAIAGFGVLPLSSEEILPTSYYFGAWSLYLDYDLYMEEVVPCIGRFPVMRRA